VVLPENFKDFLERKGKLGLGDVHKLWWFFKVYFRKTLRKLDTKIQASIPKKKLLKLISKSHNEN
jgi:hypothetical protein